MGCEHLKLRVKDCSAFESYSHTIQKSSAREQFPFGIDHPFQYRLATSGNWLSSHVSKRKSNSYDRAPHGYFCGVSLEHMQIRLAILKRLTARNVEDP